MKKICALLGLLLPALASAAYSLSATEAAVLDAVLRDELNTYTQGGNSLIGARLGLPAATAETVSRAYANGPTARFPASLDLTMLIAGPVAAGASDGQIVSFATSGSPTVRAHLPAGLAPAGHLALACSRMEWADGSPTFMDCRDGTLAGKEETDRLKADLDNFYQGKPTTVQVSQLAVNISVYASLLTPGHGCPKNIDTCRQAIQAVDGAAQSKQLPMVVQRFQQAGLDLSPYQRDKAAAKPGR
ncbi:hypothetical protein IPU70_31675 [Achromobacter sp. SD115]|uniref:hypothetical protein n=1 Tax=Achromobacter sp. SD115 TaxID=2782011 RepID=UPI001A962AA8|nr:hypothetical protein [Achromobacter sp. SD115]MBO1018155.1 hypothetical protein [Achromobacter sp. SD115]